MSQLKECINSAAQFQLSKKEAILIIEEIANSMVNNWKNVCEESELSAIVLVFEENSQINRLNIK